MVRPLIWPAALALGLLIYPADGFGPALAENVAGDGIEEGDYGDGRGANVRRREHPADDSSTGETSGGGDGKKSSGGGGGGGASAEEAITSAVITEVERRILGDYARKHPDAFDGGGGGKGKGKGKGKKGLPPGIAMNLQRGKPLPPGLRDRHIPADLRSLLPGRNNARLVPAGEDVLLVDRETEIILDVVKGVLRGMGG